MTRIESGRVGRDYPLVSHRALHDAVVTHAPVASSTSTSTHFVCFVCVLTVFAEPLSLRALRFGFASFVRFAPDHSSHGSPPPSTAAPLVMITPASGVTGNVWACWKFIVFSEPEPENGIKASPSIMILSWPSGAFSS
ncbi:MAG: hypothetical protein ACI9R3_001617 [Verrucomicrobiales bacterium]|jgi:hypothetical protein